MSNQAPKPENKILENFLGLIQSKNAKNVGDTTKVINCLAYIKEILRHERSYGSSYLTFAFNNRFTNDNTVFREVYRFSRSNEEAIRDRRNGVLRDPHGTSFHLNNYRSSTEAEISLKRIIEQLEAILSRLSPEQQLEFSSKFYYDRNVGCLEARLRPALHWASTLLTSDLPQLDELMEKCCAERPAHAKSFATFAESYCKARGYTQCWYKNQKIHITRELLKKYGEEILGETEEEPSPARQTIKRPLSAIELDWLSRSLLIALRNYNSRQVYDLIKEVSDEDQRKLLAPSNRWQLLAEMMYDPKKCRIILNHWSVAVLAENISVKNNEGKTLLDLASKEQNGDKFLALIQATPAPILDNLLQGRTMNGSITIPPILYNTAIHQPASAYLALLNKVKNEHLNDIINAATLNQTTLIHLSVVHQSADATMTLLQKISNQAIEKACTHLDPQDNSNLMELFMTHQTPRVVAAFLNRIDPGTLKRLFRPHMAKQIASYLGHEPSWQTEPLLSRLFELAGEEITKLCRQLWLIGKDLAPSVIKHCLPYLKASIENKEILAAWENVVSANPKRPPVDRNGVPIITTGSGKKISLEDFIDNEEKTRNRVAQLWEEGLASLEDYRTLQRLLPSSLATLAMHELHRAGLLFKGCILPFSPRRYLKYLRPYQDLVTQNDTLIKIIKPEHWSDFSKQLQNYNYRPSLRIAVDKNTITHKFVHLSNEIVPYQFHNPRRKNKVYTSTKKIPATLLSKKLSTPVFGEHDPRRLLVGIVAKGEASKIKAMLAYDTGTFHRIWTGNKEAVENYSKRAEKINYTQLSSFREMVNESPKMNEVLNKFSRDDLLYHVVVTDTQEARTLVRQRRTDSKQRLNLDLPIFFHDRYLRQQRPYSVQEQMDDEIALRLGLSSYNSIRVADEEARKKIEAQAEKQLREQARVKPALEFVQQAERKQHSWLTALGFFEKWATVERAIREKLMQVKTEIERKPSWLSFFGSLFNLSGSSSRPGNAAKILDLIRMAEAKQSSWSETKQEVEAIISLEKNKKVFTSNDSKSFYNRLSLLF